MSFREEEELPFDSGEPHGACRLCLSVAPLQESHVIPRYVMEWLKKTGSRYFRGALDPNRRRQDGPKYHWLCQSCEQRLGRLESSFKRLIFLPYLEGGKVELTYGAETYDFVLSILWRGLRVCRSQPQTRDICAEARETWRARLLDPALPSPEVHLGLTKVTPLGARVPGINLNRYLTRGFDMTIASSDIGQPGGQCFMFVRFARFMCFAPILPFAADAFVGTAVDPRGGCLDGKRMEIRDIRISEFLFERAAEARTRRELGLSERQRQVIAEEARRDRGRLLATPLMAAIRADEAATVDPTLSRRFKDVGRNERCPCGSGRKYKRCHGA